MSTETRPPAPPQAAPPQPIPPQSAPARPNGSLPRSAPRVIALLTAALGAAVVVGTVASAAVSTFDVASSHSLSTFVGVRGVTALDLDVDAAELTVVFDDVDGASLEVEDSGGGEWTFERDGAALRVASPRAPFTSWFRGGNGDATLTLPNELAGLDADVAMAGGSFEADGDFGDLEIELSGGEVTIGGSADTVAADVAAGRGEVKLENVSSARLSLGAGELIAELSGSAPEEVTASVSAGSLELTLPDETYDVTSELAAGDVDNRLRTDPGATRTVFVEVSAGSAVLRADD
ncbi:hypothetical protein ACFXP7_03600 [Microbacterium sp. P06]|uniref:hypothetical protein n=1 Tax=Microbacterium sp. P06 TaxID=3366949 RepID=UPI0037475C5E